ncbi:MAG: hypothetical protein ACON47_09275 [Flavobacteriaceae bacterium]
MYALLQTVHSYWAYLVLIGLLAATINALLGRVQNRAFRAQDLRLSLFGLIFSHIQLLIGLILYFVSPWFQQWSQGVGAVMKNAESRLYLVEHPTTNILAIILITMGWSMHKRQNQDVKKFSRIGFFYALGLLLLLSRIPWQSWLG